MSVSSSETAVVIWRFARMGYLRVGLIITSWFVNCANYFYLNLFYLFRGHFLVRIKNKLGANKYIGWDKIGKSFQKCGINHRSATGFFAFNQYALWDLRIELKRLQFNKRREWLVTETVSLFRSLPISDCFYCFVGCCRIL